MQQIRRSQMASDAMSSSGTPASSCTIGSFTWCQAMVSRNPWNNTLYENSSAVDPGNNATSAHMLWEDNGGMHHTAPEPKGFTELHTSDKNCKVESENVAMSPHHSRPATEHDLMGHSICAPYPYTEPAFLGAAGGESVVHQSAQGVRMVLPLEVTTEEPVYVNAKQYHGILRRRQLRAKAELENKVVKNRKPYLHESRHKHAMRRARDGGGRFVNKKKSDSTSNNTPPCSSNVNSSEAKNCISDSHGCPGSEASGMQGSAEYVQWGYEYQRFKVMKDWV
ncbi:PREDICTED: nuclear transcription factor Y subunit A-7-like isoform X2 [Ipomoea nil]|uniref:nuclear transcription factor Y subunit A-7-like isoform X2 n=1 Tax=Ipomoea nil TaxID=35883 RepID=UPI000901BBFB|nr:PREDICTED: nuclear transcription factor Y subunit A-7-like isoform X2 [Ipomoea nil]